MITPRRHQHHRQQQQQVDQLSMILLSLFQRIQQIPQTQLLIPMDPNQLYQHRNQPRISNHLVKDYKRNTLEVFNITVRILIVKDIRQFFFSTSETGHTW